MAAHSIPNTTTTVGHRKESAHVCFRMVITHHGITRARERFTVIFALHIPLFKRGKSRVSIGQWGEVNFVTAPQRRNFAAPNPCFSADLAREGRDFFKISPRRVTPNQVIDLARNLLRADRLILRRDAESEPPEVAPFTFNRLCFSSFSLSFNQWRAAVKVVVLCCRASSGNFGMVFSSVSAFKRLSLSLSG